MGSTRGMVQVVRRNYLVLDALIVILNAMVGVIALEYEQVLDRELVVLVPTNLQPFLSTLRLLYLTCV